MTRKHYEMVAAAVSHMVERADRWLIANLLADTFENDNPRFDRDRFIAACRPTEVGKPGEEYASILP
jgi:hypothetical protein